MTSKTSSNNGPDALASTPRQSQLDNDFTMQYIRCNACAETFDNASDLRAHNFQLHPQSGRLSMILSIKPLKPTNAASIRNLMMSAYPEEECNSQSEIVDLLADCMNLSFAAWHGNKMVAFVLTQITNMNSHSTYMHTIVVQEEYRGKGIGKTLIELVIDKYSAQKEQFGFKRIVLHCELLNQRAISIYKRAGFRVRETINNLYGNGRHGLLMSRQL